MPSLALIFGTRYQRRPLAPSFSPTTHVVLLPPILTVRPRILLHAPFSPFCVSPIIRVSGRASFVVHASGRVSFILHASGRVSFIVHASSRASIMWAARPFLLHLVCVSRRVSPICACLVALFCLRCGASLPHASFLCASRLLCLRCVPLSCLSLVPGMACLLPPVLLPRCIPSCLFPPFHPGCVLFVFFLCFLTPQLSQAISRLSGGSFLVFLLYAAGSPALPSVCPLCPVHILLVACPGASHCRPSGPSGPSHPRRSPSPFPLAFSYMVLNAAVSRAHHASSPPFCVPFIVHVSRRVPTSGCIQLRLLHLGCGASLPSVSCLCASRLLHP